MSQEMDEMKKLNRKRIDGTATKEELLILKTMINSSCMIEAAIKLGLEIDEREYLAQLSEKNKKNQ